MERGGEMSAGACAGGNANKTQRRDVNVSNERFPEVTHGNGS